MTTLHVIEVLASASRPARNVFRTEFLGSKPQSFLLIRKQKNEEKKKEKRKKNLVAVGKPRINSTLELLMIFDP